MRAFDYIKEPEKLLTPEIVQMIGKIHEHKGKQELFLEASLLKLISLSASIFEDVAVATAGEFSVCHEFFLLEM